MQNAHPQIPGSSPLGKPSWTHRKEHSTTTSAADHSSVPASCRFNFLKLVTVVPPRQQASQHERPKGLGMVGDIFDSKTYPRCHGACFHDLFSQKSSPVRNFFLGDCWYFLGKGISKVSDGGEDEVCFAAGGATITWSVCCLSYSFGLLKSTDLSEMAVLFESDV